ncbi:hypothetical protein [Caulobacter sp. NIBR1757]|uniref:hypothetical protein n=1 Tax=Caulobacter sp. NIBR1757 TaxID=3016000 RepID=UPI0022F0A32B|nr:hypothetical protein [Caulobacter sp. NIBR1757]WGM37257.1 hypothetical protein AMEJIAPC_00151 [Caulobacter sp. NIBR1757]
MKYLPLLLALALVPAAPVVAQDAPEGGAWTDCTVAEIAAYRDRIEITCAAPAAAGKTLPGEKPDPRRFAVESRDPLTEGLLTLAIEAKSKGRPLGILYVVSPEANPADCGRLTCRRAAGAVLR